MSHPRNLLFVVCLLLAGCGAHKSKTAPPSAAAGQAPAGTVAPATAGAAKTSLSPIKRDILALANREWEYFGRQRVVIDRDEESIPHVGMWEDDNDEYAFRVNWYWRAVAKPGLSGNNCSQPWSAAFVSWIMKNAGVPEHQFPPAEAHWVYLNRIIRGGDGAYSGFVPHPIDQYPPQPGDLICATRGHPDEPVVIRSYRDELLTHTKLHCDIVVNRDSGILEAIGGNVRNSVSKSILKLDKDGLLQPTRRRPWFIVLENRL